MRLLMLLYKIREALSFRIIRTGKLAQYRMLEADYARLGQNYSNAYQRWGDDMCALRKERNQSDARVVALTDEVAELKHQAYGAEKVRQQHVAKIIAMSDQLSSMESTIADLRHHRDRLARRCYDAEQEVITFRKLAVACAKRLDRYRNKYEKPKAARSRKKS
jgi:chromosome segregation ATPase